ncbi:hypothetical protein BDV06DRAFT_204889 [Aspergillus oleicola]
MKHILSSLLPLSPIISQASKTVGSRIFVCCATNLILRASHICTSKPYLTTMSSETRTILTPPFSHIVGAASKAWVSGFLPRVFISSSLSGKLLSGYLGRRSPDSSAAGDGDSGFTGIAKFWTTW